MSPLQISRFTATSALGRGNAAQRAALLAGRTGLARKRFDACDLPCWIGEVEGLDAPLSAPWRDWDCRNNRLAAVGLDQDGFREAVAAARGRYGASRIGVFVGTSTSGVLQTEVAYRERDRAATTLPSWYNHRTTHNPQSPAEFVRLQLGLDNLAASLCTACSSSAKVFASAHRAMAAGLCDAAVVGGVDTLCLTTLYGFNSLQLVSDDICRPADVRRRGLSIGEAAGFALLEPGAGALNLLGYGESSDAYHMSAPEPEGRGAQAAMRAALDRAGVAGVDYVNLHGTATPANDFAEDRALCAVLGTATPCSSTKGFTGHTLGAAGILEAAFALLAVEHGFLPQSLNTERLDPELRGAVLLAPRRQEVRRVLSNSFGFGGNNASLVLGRAA